MTRTRLVHPVAWWVWAIGLAWCAMRTENVLLLLTIMAVTGFVVNARRDRAAWGNAYRLLLIFGGMSIVFTVVLQIILGTRVPGHTLFMLPRWDLPSWTAGLSVGGPVTGEALLNSFTAGLRLAALIACFGAANSLAHPGRLLKLVPAALYELGVAVVVALTLIPQLTESIGRVRNAQRLRGRSIRGLSGLRALTVPVLSEALERAIAVAASMDSRGYGRRAAVPGGQRRAINAVLLLGLCAALAGSYFVIDPGSDHATGVLALIAGTLLAVGAGFAAGRQVRRTVYRKDPWGGPDWLTVAVLVVAVGCYLLGGPNPDPSGVLQWPSLPLLPFLGTLVAALPGLWAPGLSTPGFSTGSSAADPGPARPPLGVRA
jgi:energy-coupling factor transport system permease protein